MRVSVFGLGYVGMRVGGVVCRRRPPRRRRRRQRRQGGEPSTRAAARSSSPASTSCCRDSVAERTAARDDRHGRSGRDTDVSLVCVGTPSRRNGSLDLTLSRARLRADRRGARRTRPRYHVVVVRSTVLPGTTHGVVIPALERDVGQEVRRRLRRLGQSRVPARRHGAQGLPQAAADAGRPQPRRRRQRRRSRSIRRSTRRSSAPASASPR